MAEGGNCPCNGVKKKTGVFKLFGLGKKKKKKVCGDATNCPRCIQNSLYLNASNIHTSNLNASPYAMSACYEREQKLVTEARRKEPNYVELPPERKFPDEGNEYAVPILSPEEPPCSSSRHTNPLSDEDMMLAIQHHPPHCACAPCKKKRYDDSLLAMDAQVILQNSLLQNTLSDTAGLVCVIL